MMRPNSALMGTDSHRYVRSRTLEEEEENVFDHETDGDSNNDTGSRSNSDFDWNSVEVPDFESGAPKPSIMARVKAPFNGEEDASPKSISIVVLMVIFSAILVLSTAVFVYRRRRQERSYSSSILNKNDGQHSLGGASSRSRASTTNVTAQDREQNKGFLLRIREYHQGRSRSRSADRAASPSGRRERSGGILKKKSSNSARNQASLNSDDAMLMNPCQSPTDQQDYYHRSLALQRNASNRNNNNDTAAVSFQDFVSGLMVCCPQPTTASLSNPCPLSPSRSGGGGGGGGRRQQQVIREEDLPPLDDGTLTDVSAAFSEEEDHSNMGPMPLPVNNNDLNDYVHSKKVEL